MVEWAWKEKGGESMRILYCIPHLYNAGGMERVLTQKVNWLVAHTPYDITIVTTEHTPQGMDISYFPLDKRVEVIELNINFNADYNAPLLHKFFAHLRKERLYRQALGKVLAHKKVDLCISLCGKEIAFLHQLACRSIAELHFQISHRKQLLETAHHGCFWSLLGAIRTQQLIREVQPLEQLVVLTEADKEDWLAAGCTNVRCIPNPCCLDGKEIQKKPMSSNKKTLLTVGRLHREKGYDLLLDAWKKIESLYPEWILRIVGEGEERMALEKQIKALGLKHVELPGRSSNIVSEYANADAFVLSSRYEGLPLAMMEAMWCGIPCIAFDCPRGARALIETSRGWLVPNGDIEALSAQLEYVITHPEEAVQRAKKAQSYAQETYSEAAIMPQWVQLIESCK